MNAQNCSDDSGILGSAYNYCQWSYTEEDIDSDSDFDSDYPYDWDCGNDGGGAICEAFADSKCIMVDLDVEETDCYGNTFTQSLKGYTQCCKSGDNCNHEDIDTSDCTQSTEYETFFKDLWDCQNDRSSTGAQLLCDDSADSLGCSDLLAIYRQQSKCLCQAYGDIYTKVSAATKIILQKEADEGMAGYSYWNDALGCDINLKCDLGSGGVVKNNSGVSGLVYIVGLVWTLLVGLYIVY